MIDMETGFGYIVNEKVNIFCATTAPIPEKKIALQYMRDTSLNIGSTREN